MPKGVRIGVTAPSSGVPIELHDLIKLASMRMENKGYKNTCGDTVWTQYKFKSAPAKQRVDVFNKMISDDSIDIIIPPWGDELLIEILEYVDFDSMREKWVLGYSDTTVLLLVITLKTGIATAHGANLIDLRGEYFDDTTARWENVLSTKTRESILQRSSEKYQKAWQHDKPSPCIFHLTGKTRWKTVQNDNIQIHACLVVVLMLYNTWWEHHSAKWIISENSLQMLNL